MARHSLRISSRITSTKNPALFDHFSLLIWDYEVLVPPRPRQPCLPFRERIGKALSFFPGSPQALFFVQGFKYFSPCSNFQSASSVVPPLLRMCHGSVKLPFFFSLQEEETCSCVLFRSETAHSPPFPKFLLATRRQDCFPKEPFEETFRTPGGVFFSPPL